MEKINKYGWTRNGNYPDSIVEVVTESSKTPPHQVIEDKESLIIEALKAAPYKRGFTYKEIANKFNCKPEYVFRIRKKHKIN